MKKVLISEECEMKYMKLSTGIVSNLSVEQQSLPYLDALGLFTAIKI